MAWWEPLPVAPAHEASLVIYVIEPEVSENAFVYVVEPTLNSAYVAVVPIFEAARDQASITIEKITQTYFRDNIKRFIPYEYWRMDAKRIDEGGGEGNLENFMEVFAITLDEIKQAIDEFTLLFDIDHCDPRYLRTIAEMINYPLEGADNTAEQRKQLKSAIEWYKSKGSKRAFVAILYAFGYYAEIIPLWTQNTEDNPYEVFTETIPGVAAGNDPPNDYPLLIENGGTWFRSPHFGIRLKAIVGDNHLDIDWGSMTEGEIPITDEVATSSPDGSVTSFVGTLAYYPLLAGSVDVDTYVHGAPTTDIVDDGVGGLVGTSLTAKIVDSTPDGVITSFGTDVAGTTIDFASDPSSVMAKAQLEDGTFAIVTDDGLGVFTDVPNGISGTVDYATGEWHLDFAGSVPKVDTDIEFVYTTVVTGTIDYDTGDWTLEFATPPSYNADIIFSYTYDWENLVLSVGYHKAFYTALDALIKAGASLKYHFTNEEFWYMWRRIEFLRPVFTVLDWIEHGLEMYEWFSGPTLDEPVMTVNPTRNDKGWYLGYCDLDDIQYTRLDIRLLGPDYLSLTSPLGPGAPATVTITDEVAESVSSVITHISGILANQWIYTGVEFTVTIGAAPYTVLDNGEGVLVGEDATVYGTIDYITGAWELIFEGVNPDNPSDILVDYVYTTEVPPCDRSGVFPRGSTALPFPHLRDPQEGYCHPPEELFIDWYWLPEEEYQLPLLRNGMNLYPAAGPVVYIDHADFPSRGFANSLGAAGHANTFTREFGYSTRPLSLLRVQANPDPEDENWENQNVEWENWTGPWENIGD
jgi:hypothetical protein